METLSITLLLKLLRDWWKHGLFFFFLNLKEVIGGKKREKRKQMDSEKIYFPKNCIGKLSESQIFDIQKHAH